MKMILILSTCLLLPGNISAQGQDPIEAIRQEMDKARKILGIGGEQSRVQQVLEQWGFHKSKGGGHYEIVLTIPQAKYFRSGRLTLQPYNSEYNNTLFPKDFINRLEEYPAYLRMKLDWDLTKHGVIRGLTIPLLPLQGNGDGYKDPLELLSRLIPFVHDGKLDTSKLVSNPDVAKYLSQRESAIDAVLKDWTALVSQLETLGFKRLSPGDPLSGVSKHAQGGAKTTISMDLLPDKKLGGVTVLFSDPSLGLSSRESFASIEEFRQAVKLLNTNPS